MTRRARERTPFGERLVQARAHSGLSQAALAKAAGMAQSTLAEAEYTANGSSKTAQLAIATGVNPTWLATGRGEFLPPQIMDPAMGTAVFLSEAAQHAAGHRRVTPDEWPAPPPTPLQPAPNVFSVVKALGALLQAHDHLSRLSVAPLLQRLAEHPDETEHIARQVQKILTDTGNPAALEFSPSPAKPENVTRRKISQKA